MFFYLLQAIKLSKILSSKAQLTITLIPVSIILDNRKLLPVSRDVKLPKFSNHIVMNYGTFRLLYCLYLCHPLLYVSIIYSIKLEDILWLQYLKNWEYNRHYASRPGRYIIFNKLTCYYLMKFKKRKID